MSKSRAACVLAKIDPRLVLSRQRAAVGEVEAELVGADVGAGLPDMRPEPRPQRRVQQMRGGVVALGRVARRRVHTREHALARAQLVPALGHERDDLVVAEPEHIMYPRAAVTVLTLDPARVGDLPAAGGVERRLDELHEHVAVLAGERADRGRQLGRLVALELGREVRLRRERGGVLAQAGAGAFALAREPRLAPLVLHQRLEPLLVDAQAVLGDELERQVEREPKGVVKPERVAR